MKIVVDSNRLVASLLKDSTTREILHYKNFEFIAPEFINEEIRKYKEYFLKKSRIRSGEFDLLLSLLLERVTLIQQNSYEKQSKELKATLPDPKDIPYLACCIATKADGIWSHDPHFLEQNKVKVFTNKDLLDIFRKQQASDKESIH
jgi:predicted nucleic acid-binding protein